MSLQLFHIWMPLRLQGLIVKLVVEIGKQLSLVSVLDKRLMILGLLLDAVAGKDATELLHR